MDSKNRLCQFWLNANSKAALIIIISILIFIVGLIGDDTMVGTDAHTVYPINNNDIEMLAESVYIDLVDMKADCYFIFWNTSNETLAAILGFPGNMDEGGDNNVVIENFQSFVDGDPVDIETRDDTIKLERWYTKKVVFMPKALKRIRDTYDITWSGNTLGESWFSYVMKTGANWKGKIGKADIFIRFTCLPLEITKASPSNFIIKDSIIEWHFENYEPSENIYFRRRALSCQTLTDRVCNHEILGSRLNEPIQITFSSGGELNPFIIEHGSLCYTTVQNGKKAIAFGDDVHSAENFKDMAVPFEELSHLMEKAVASFLYYCAVRQGNNWDVFQMNGFTDFADMVDITKGMSDSDEFPASIIGDNDILFNSVSKDGISSVWRYVNATTMKLFEDTCDCRNPSVYSPDMNIVLERKENGNCDIYQYRNEKLKKLTDYQGYDGEPAIFDNMIAFVSDRSGNRDLWLMDTLGMQLTQLTNDAAVDGEPFWSENGSLLLFTSVRNDGVPHIFAYALPLEIIEKYCTSGRVGYALLEVARYKGRVDHFKKGNKFILYGEDLEGAKKIYNKIIEKFPFQDHVHSAMLQLGKIAAYEGDTIKSLGYFTKILSDKIADGLILYWTAYALENINEIKMALKVYLRIIHNDVYKKYHNDALVRINAIKDKK